MLEEYIARFAIWTPPILLALTCHEFAHGYVAYRLGDPTAKMMGRLSLNPLKHLDPLGTLAFFIINLGWAKPVPVNGTFFKNPHKDMLWVALAGPMTNLVLAVMSAVIAKFIMLFGTLFSGSMIAKTLLVPLFEMAAASVWINIVLCIFNFLPIPPLDGSRILMGVLPKNMTPFIVSLEKYGFILILVLAFTGVLSSVILPIIRFVTGFLLS